MRPVRLTMEGFASFRNRTEVDFSDAQYFALVGPTGSGKSTVIDAMTFALYGTVYRWQDAKMVSNALAPTSNRGYVSLIFDTGGQRYQAVRELRRSGGKNPQVNTSNVSLLRYLDPSAVPADGVEPEAENLLGHSTDVRDLTRKVTELVGLDLKEFCQCVVLPQGDFAQFLHAKRPERNAILLKLLDIGDHDGMKRAAFARAQQAKIEATTLARELERAGDGSDSAEQAAREVADRLHATAETLRGQIDPFTGLLDGNRETTAALGKVRADLAAVSSLTAAPEGLEQLMGRVTVARDAAAAATADADAAAEQLGAATSARAAGPDRARVDAALSNFRKRDRLVADRPRAQQAVVTRAETADGARRRHEAAIAAQQEVESALDRAVEAHRTSTAHVTELERLLSRYTVTVPDRVEELATDLAAARATEEAARDALGAVDFAHQMATDRLRTLTDAGSDTRTLQRAGTALSKLPPALAGLARAWDELARAAARFATAAATAQAAESDRDAAREAEQAARVAHASVELRSTLQVGHACPVCTQTVHTLPPVEKVDTRTEAHAAVRAAEERYTAAHRQREDAARSDASARNKWQRAVTAVSVSTTALLDALPDYPPPAEVATEPDRESYLVGRSALEALAQSAAKALDRLDADSEDTTGDSNADLLGRSAALQPLLEDLTAVLTLTTDRLQQFTATCTDTEQALAKARDRARAAADEARGLLQAEQQARGALATATGVLQDLGCPDAGKLLAGGDLGSAWRTLTVWSAEQRDALQDGELAQAHAAATAAMTDLEAAEEVHRTATEEVRAASQELQRASTEQTRAETELATLERRVTELDAELTDVPPVEVLTTQLAECVRLEDAVKEATSASSAAQRRRKQAQERLAALTGEIENACSALREARDRVAYLSAPPVRAEAGIDLGTEWAKLVGWAQGQRTELAAAEAELVAKQDRQRAEMKLQTEAVEEVLAAHEITLAAADRAADPNLARAAAGAATLAARDADTAVEKVLAARARSAHLTSKIAAAEERMKVAHTLSELLTARRFPQWLADSVLDNLVGAASQSLRTLSNGQFSLMHDNGEFYVIDHNDADMPRSVRTLSGGETFQTSLALALALAEQLAALGAGGASRLESIFLDEGFGTLDPEALDTVAVTLESLAAGDRMVGVVTHVAALAERATLRYQVRRVNNISTVTRESV